MYKVIVPCLLLIVDMRELYMIPSIYRKINSIKDRIDKDDARIITILSIVFIICAMIISVSVIYAYFNRQEVVDILAQRLAIVVISRTVILVIRDKLLKGLGAK